MVKYHIVLYTNELMQKLSNIFWASKFAHSDCSCNESNAYNNTLPADSNTDVPFTICP